LNKKPIWAKKCHAKLGTIAQGTKKNYTPYSVVLLKLTDTRTKTRADFRRKITHKPPMELTIS
jgi:hypothetical protein